MTSKYDGHDALDELYWRSEILQAMYWMRGEELASEVGPDQLAQFLVAETGIVASFMRRLAGDGYLEAVDDDDGPAVRYRLTAFGAAEGGRSFADEFADLTRPGHGECAPGCWCQNPEHAGEPCPSHAGAHHGP